METDCTPDPIGKPPLTTMQAEDPRIVFLIYESRSGSTLLASLLDQFPSVGVSIEDGLPMGLALSSGIESSPDKFINHLQGDSKFVHWEIDYERLKRLLEKNPEKDPAILTFAEYFRSVKPTAQVFVYKKGGYLYNIEELRERYPQCLFLHIFRDPRAVYASQRKNSTSIKGVPFCVDPVKFSTVWNRAMRLSRKYSDALDFMEINYESLVFDKEEVFGRVTQFMGLKDMVACSDHEKTYAQRIPSSQSHLHENVGREMKTDRIDAWEESLSAFEIGVIEKICEPEMDARGFRVTSAFSARFEIRFFLNLLKSHFFTIFRTLLSLAQPSLLLRKIRARRKAI